MKKDKFIHKFIEENSNTKPTCQAIEEMKKQKTKKSLRFRFLATASSFICLVFIFIGITNAIIQRSGYSQDGMVPTETATATQTLTETTGAPTHTATQTTGAPTHTATQTTGAPTHTATQTTGAPTHTATETTGGATQSATEIADPDFTIVFDDSIKGFIYEYDEVNNGYKIIYYNDNQESVTIEETYDDGVHGVLPVLSIGAQAFFKNESLRSISIPNNIKEIGDYAFFDCFGLTEILIPDSVDYMGKSIFGKHEHFVVSCVSSSMKEHWARDWNSFGRYRVAIVFYGVSND